MKDKPFMWTPDLSMEMFRLRFENDWLFSSKKQPWPEFHRILIDNGFPKEITVRHVRKKWSYTYDCYRLAKKEKNKKWLYYKLFDKHFGKRIILEKYESWSDEWRLKLIIALIEANESKLSYSDLWKNVEKAMRSQDLPIECCVHDMKGLWHYIQTTFSRKHRALLRKGADNSEWPLYDVTLSYYEKFEPQHLANLASESLIGSFGRVKTTNNNKIKTNDNNVQSEEFHWTKDITESFIQIRLQNDWIFKTKKRGWNDLLTLMIEEYGFPKSLTGRELCAKWSATISDYQKAKATKNKSWIYYNLFAVYLGEGSLTINPITGWPQEWLMNLINARIDLDHLFTHKFTWDEPKCWREVEKKLRIQGIPLHLSLFDLPEIWLHLSREFRWKHKFASKGMLNEPWPYFDVMSRYVELKKERKEVRRKNAQHKTEDSFQDDNDDYEDDLKLFELKQRIQVKPKVEVIEANQCRACFVEGGCVNVFDTSAEDGVNLADKLKIICGIEISSTDTLPIQICFDCLKDLENAYKFRKKCEATDKQFRELASVKVEITPLDAQINSVMDVNTDGVFNDSHTPDDLPSDSEFKATEPVKKERQPRKPYRKKKKYDENKYAKVCEICGKSTRHLAAHLDVHAVAKMYSCDLCDKKFKFRSGLTIHKSVHNPTPKKTCEVCGKAFHHLAQYRKHFAYHANERKYECDTCFKRFNALDILRVHKRIHADERPFSCSDCGKTFRTAGCVSRHKRIVHKKIKVQ